MILFKILSVTVLWFFIITLYGCVKATTTYDKMSDDKEQEVFIRAYLMKGGGEKDT